MEDNKKKQLIIMCVLLVIIIAAAILAFGFIKKTSDSAKAQSKAKEEERLDAREKTEAQNVAKEKSVKQDDNKDAKKAQISTEDFLQKTEADKTLENLDDIDAGKIINETDIDRDELDRYFKSYEISDELFSRIYGDDRSYKTYCTVPREDLRYLKMLHVNFYGEICVGEMMVNQAIADDVLDIFKELFISGYQIERMQLVDDYNASDSESIAHNNTSAFNFRPVTGGSTLSYHGMGCAIDINPINNPYIWYDEYGNLYHEDPDAELYLDRDAEDAAARHMINHDDLCYRLFIEHGFEWGGDWSNPVDYQHFEKAAAYYTM